MQHISNYGIYINCNFTVIFTIKNKQMTLSYPGFAEKYYNSDVL